MESKIIIRIFGGTGNQLFQLAFGIYISRLTNKRLYLDTSFFETSFLENNKHFENRSSILKALKFKYFVFTGNFLISNILLNRYVRKLLRSLKIFIIRIGRFYYILESFNLNKFSFKDNCSYYFDGYWQDVNHLYDDTIFQLLNNSLSSLISLPFLNEYQLPTISVHIRAPDNKSKNFYVLPPPLYYYNSINFFNRLYNNKCLFLLFSNDQAWLEKNFNLKGVNYLKCSLKNNFNEIDELFLMARSDNIIISNSSYSWWAARFNNNKKKIVICPALWQYGIDFKKIYPKDWIILE
jgi:hypothetical protein